MKTIAMLGLLGGLTLAVTGSQAAEQIPWVSDFRTACGMAAEQHRLVLLHFYSDNCAPCVRLEQNVFSRADVGEAVAQNYLPVKIHVEKTPQLANRYGIRAWPTDVFVTPAGLELYRTVSPQDPTEYVAVLNRVAQQSAGNVRRPTNPRQIAAAASSGVALAANEAAVDLSAAAARTEQQLATSAQQVQQRATGLMEQSTNLLQQSANAAQQSAAAVEQSAGAAQRWGQQAGEAVQQYEQQAGQAYQQARNQAGQAIEQAEKQTAAAAEHWRTTAQQTAEQVGTAAQNLAAPWQQLAEQLPTNRRSAFMPQAGPVEPPAGPVEPPAGPSAVATPPAAPPHAAAVAAPPVTPSVGNAPQVAGAQPWQSPIASVQPPAPTTNPWLAANRAVSPGTSASPPAPPPASPSPHDNERQLVPASQAPPVALDGFCPVTLIETMSRSPEDRSAWKKGNVKFGAIHRGRTYLFTSVEQQQKFLADPDAYAPAFSGYDPVRYAERGELVDGKRAYGLITPDKHVFLFADEGDLQRFRQAPTRYTAALQQAMASAGAGASYR
jgi:thioredoxin-related protein/YHS domain-containing protein